MNLNVLAPGKAIESAFEKPNVLLALLLVLVPAIIAAISFLVNAAPVDWVAFALEHILKKYVLFFVSALLVFAVGIIFNSKEMPGKFFGIVSALGTVYAITIALAVLSLFAPLLFSQESLAAIQNIAGTSATQEEFFFNAQLLFGSMPKGINLALFSVFLGASFILALWQLYLAYKTIAFVSRHKPWVNFTCLFIVVLLLGYASMLIAF